MLEPSIRAGSEGWYRVLGPGQKVGTEYSGRVRRLVPKPGPAVSLLNIDETSKPLKPRAPSLPHWSMEIRAKWRGGCWGDGGGAEIRPGGSRGGIKRRSSLTGGYRQAKVAATRHWLGQCRPLENTEIKRGKGEQIGRAPFCFPHHLFLFLHPLGFSQKSAFAPPTHSIDSVA